MSTHAAIPDAARIATAVGITTCGLLCGTMFASSAIFVPALLGASHAKDKTLLAQLFARLYYTGRNIAVPLTGSTALLFAYAAHAHPAARAPLLAAAGATAAALPYTRAAMHATIHRLLAAAAPAAAAPADAPPMDVDAQVRDVVRWARLNYVRALLPLAGLVLALSAVLGG